MVKMHSVWHWVNDRPVWVYCSWAAKALLKRAEMKCSESVRLSWSYIALTKTILLPNEVPTVVFKKDSKKQPLKESPQSCTHHPSTTTPLSRIWQLRSRLRMHEIFIWAEFAVEETNTICHRGGGMFSAILVKVPLYQDPKLPKVFSSSPASCHWLLFANWRNSISQLQFAPNLKSLRRLPHTKVSKNDSSASMAGPCQKAKHA